MLCAALFLRAFGCLLKSGGVGSDKGDGGDTQVAVAVFELAGSWEYTGGVAGLTNLLVISETQMEDSGDYNGTGWTLVFAIDSWDNEGDRANLELVEIDSFSHYTLGDVLYMRWQIEGSIGRFYYAMSDYPEPTGGTEGSEFFTYTRG